MDRAKVKSITTIDKTRNSDEYGYYHSDRLSTPFESATAASNILKITLNAAYRDCLDNGILVDTILASLSPEARLFYTTER